MQKVNPSFYGGIPQVPQFPSSSEVPNRLVSSSAGDNDGPIYIQQGLVTYEKPILEVWQDINIPANAAGSVTQLRAGQELPTNCVGVRFIDMIAGVTVSINGGGTHKIFNMDSISNIIIKSLIIFTDATGTVTVQTVGTGD